MTKLKALENRIKVLEIKVRLLIKFKKNTICYLEQLHKLNGAENESN